jgi:hypothetical protein
VPVLSIFFGIIIRVFHEDHSPPHFHVEYAEHRSVVEIETGRVLAGKLPSRVRRLVEEWRVLNVDGLRRAWGDAQAGRQPRRIPPLT